MGKLVHILFLFFVICTGPANANTLFYEYSGKEKSHIKKALYYADKRKFDLAEYEAKKVNNPLFEKLISWQKYRKGYSNSSYEEIQGFIKNNPDWPDKEKLNHNAEQVIKYKEMPFTVIKWFEDKDPVTPKGKWLLANARLKKSHKPETVDHLIKESWINGDFSRKEEKDFLSKHSKRITQNDHIAKINRLLWERKITAAKRIIPKVSRPYRNLFNARILLMKNSRGLTRAIQSVPKSLQSDSGLLYERARWRQKRNKVDGVFEMVNRLKKDADYQNKWWRVRHILARDFLKSERYEDAYNVIKSHGLEKGTANFAEAEWLAGWISLRFQNNPRLAYEHFYRMYKNVKYPISKARGSYWAGRAAEANSNHDIAARWYKLSSQFPTAFYGQIAINKLNQETKLDVGGFPDPTRSEIANHSDNDLLKIVNLLVQFDRLKLAEKFIKQAINNAKTPGEAALISEMGLAIEQTQLSVIASKKAHRLLGAELLRTSYPTPKYKMVEGANKPLSYAIIRQESLFNHTARSHANARGLMQIIPSTAKKTSRKLGLRYSTSKLTRNPDYNTQLGSYYIKSLLKKKDQSLILAIASYNAGPGNARRWIRTYGDPRKLTEIEDIIDWVEMIPFSETRNYVQRVLENKQVYQSIIFDLPIALTADLKPSNNPSYAKR